VLADNVGVFKESLTPYLDYVRGGGGGSSKYTSSTFVETNFGYRDDVKDGMEVSIYNPTAAAAADL
jgi:hypothetical protein